MAGAERHARLAEKILDAALSLGLSRGDRLAEQALAESCAVSRTPIRAALKLLATQGRAEKAPDGGYLLACEPGAAGLDSPPGDLPELIVRDRSARRLGAAVTVGDLMRRYDRSRSAVQKALDTLAAQGVAQRGEGQSWLFSRMPGERGALQDSYAFRLMLEPQAILSEGFRLDAARGAAVTAHTSGLLARGEHAIAAAEFQEADLAFHRLIARGAANPFLRDTLLAHHALRHLAGEATGLNDFRMRQALEEHLRMLDALSADQPALAADIMRVHLRQSMARRPSVANRGAPALAFAGI